MSAAEHPEEEEGQDAGQPAHGLTEGISIALTATQVREVLHGITGEEGVQEWLLGSLSSEQLRSDAAAIGRADLPEHQLSQSFLRGLATLRALLPVGTEKGVNQIADELGMTPSTTHRYVATLKYAGLLGQNPETRAYRLARGGEA
jgi:hypothetical protein